MKSDAARYGPGRKPEVLQQHDAQIYHLRRRLLGYFDELLLSEGQRIKVQVKFPQVESAAWADVIIEAARRGESQSSVYPPSGKRLCAECKIPHSPIYMNAFDVCYDCQLAELSSSMIHGGSPVVVRVARRLRREEAMENKPEKERVKADVSIAGFTLGQYEVALMFVQGYTLTQIAKMTNRTEQRINTMIKEMRQRLKKLGLRQLDREEDKSGASRHVRSKNPMFFKNM